MAWVIAVRWPVGLYIGALSGLQQQVSMNTILVVVAVLNWAGAALVLWLFDSTIQLFFFWQLLVAVISVVLYVVLTWFYMPGNFSQARFSWVLLKQLIPFTMSVTATSVFGTILLQADKLIVSAMLPLKTFAYYALAAMIAEAILLLATPISSAVFPKMTQMIGNGADRNELKHFFHLSSQAVNTVIIPLALVLAFFSYDVLFAYTGSHEIARNASVILPVLSIAKLLQANMLNLYSLQLAFGEMKLALYINIVSVGFFLPTVFLLVNKFGMVGAAIAWLILTFFYVFIAMPLVFHKILPKQWFHWFKVDFLLPLTCVAITVYILNFVIDLNNLGKFEVASLLTVFGLFACLVAVRSSPKIWDRLKSTQYFRGH